ncbi:MAG: hypothetical protein EA368_13585 [Leptolyngbya sp. DLM2.Bin27]|nr:MAG: hypothetical protein EA368_13585 [Leptolyngbya sp. DLM2.Bin27]
MVRLSALSRPLRRPAVWGSLAMLGLLAVVVPQYLQNPQWRSEYEPATASPSVDPTTDLGGLSSQDLADLAEIDNLAQLLNQLQPVTSSALDRPNADAASLALPQATPEPAAASPFAAYLERSRFRFSPAPSGAPGAGATLPGTQPGQLSLLSPSAAAETPSPLQQALNQRLNPASESSASPEPSRTAVGLAPSGLTPQPWMVEGSLPGVDQRFNRTTPQMSPPPGTTGYTPPPGLAPSPATAAPAAGAIAPAGLNLDFAAPVTAPVGGTVRSPQPSAFDNNLAAPIQPSPAPFSAPRPPGVYTGNGYINTFSNPSGPVD